MSEEDQKPPGLRHINAPSFASGHATGVAATRREGDDQLHITFYRVTFEVLRHSLVETETEGTYRTTLEPGDTEQVLENICRVSMSVDDARRVVETLNNQIAKYEAENR